MARARHPLAVVQLIKSSRNQERPTIWGPRMFCENRVLSLSEQQRWIHNMKHRFAESVDDAVAKWQSLNIPSTVLFCLPDQEFQKRQKSLLDAVDTCFQGCKSYLESQGILEVTQGFQHGGCDRGTTSTKKLSFPEWLAFMNNGTTPDS